MSKKCPASLLMVMRGVENMDYPEDDAFRGQNVRARVNVGSFAEAATALEAFAHKFQLQGPSVMPATIYDMHSLRIVAHVDWNGHEARVRMGPFSPTAYRKPIVTGAALTRCR